MEIDMEKEMAMEMKMGMERARKIEMETDIVIFRAREINSEIRTDQDVHDIRFSRPGSICSIKKRRGGCHPDPKENPGSS